MSVPVKVSVCVVTYNHAHYIEDCLMSIIAQAGNFSLEILVGDDCSEDGTSDIIKSIDVRYPGLIQYFRSEKRKGRGADNLLHLVSLARGEFIAHLDGDDFWLPGKLRQQFMFLQEHPDCSAVYTNALTIGGDGDLIGVFNNSQPSIMDLRYLVRGGNFLNHSSILYRSKFKENILVISADRLLDYRIHLEMAQHGNLGYINQPLTCYRVATSGSILANSNERIRRLYWETLQSIPIESVQMGDLGMGMAHFMRSVFFRAIRMRSVFLILEWWPRVLKASPENPAKMLARVFYSIIRTGFRMAVQGLCTKINGIKLGILYRR